MRRAAERWISDARLYAHQRHPWALAGSERLLVLHQPGRAGERLIRTARRLADELKPNGSRSMWKRPTSLGFPRNSSTRWPNPCAWPRKLVLARAPSRAISVAATILAYARRHNVTKIIAGKPVYSRWIEFLRGSTVDRLNPHERKDRCLRYQ